MKWGIFMHVYIIYAWFRVVRGKIHYYKNSAIIIVWFLSNVSYAKRRMIYLLFKFISLCQLIISKMGYVLILITYILKLAHSIRYSSDYVHSVYVYYSGFLKIFLDIINQYVIQFAQESYSARITTNLLHFMDVLSDINWF